VSVDLATGVEQAMETSSRHHAHFGFRFVTPLALGSTLNPINSTMISTALVAIARDYHASVAQTGWLIAGLYLTSAIAQPTMGRLADLFGPRRVYLFSLCVVALAGIAGGIAPSLGMLIGVRVLLGIGTSGAYPSAMRIFRTQADRIGVDPPRVAMGFMSFAGIATTAIGPVLGGVLTGYFGWHSIFTVNLPVSLLTILLVLLWVPKDEQPAGSLVLLMEELDLIGIALFAAFLLSLMLFLMNLDHPMWLVLPVAAVFGVVLVIHSLRRKQPFIDVQMLVRNRPLTVTYLRIAAILLIVYCILYGFAQWLEAGAGFSSWPHHNADVRRCRSGIARGCAHQEHPYSLHRWHRSSPDWLLVSVPDQPPNTCMDDRRGRHVLWPADWSNVHRYPGSGLHPGACGRDRYCIWFATYGDLYRRDHFDQSSWLHLRSACDRPRPA
jgi:MFS family permease